MNPNTLSGYTPVKANRGLASQIAESYAEVVKKFINRADVQNGKAIAYKRWNANEALLEDTPKGVGDGLSTTGWCVSASSALLSDPIFVEHLNFRNAKAKLVSIDIQERWYGHCYNGTQNKWHTAILVSDSGINLIVDITCSQFSSDFIGKWVWDFKTWEQTFRSAYCKHVITDCEDKKLSAAPIFDYSIGKTYRDYTIHYAKIFDALHDVFNITDNERRFLTEYFLYNVNIINEKLISGNLTQGDCEYLDEVNNLLSHMPFAQIADGVSVLKFKTKQQLKNWLGKLSEHDYNEIPQSMFVSKNIEEACTFNGFGTHALDRKAEPGIEWYLVLNFKKLFSVDSSFVAGTSLFLPACAGVDVDWNSLHNSGKEIMENNPNESFDKETNTIYLTINANY